MTSGPLRSRLRVPRPFLHRRWPVAVALPLVALGAGACSDGGPDAGGDAAVVATTSILADITDRVGCGEVEVTELVPRGTDSHEFEPSPRDADRLRSASLVVANGLGLEAGLTDSLEAARTDGVEVVEVGPEVDPLPADHVEGENGEEERGEEEQDRGELDPHVWMDPDRMAVAAGVIGQHLASTEGLPVSAARIEECAAGYQQELRELADEMEDALAVVPAANRKLVTGHEALGYFADRFDFEVIGAVIPSTSTLAETNPRDLEELADAVREAGVPAVFGETTQPAALADDLADKVGARIEVVELYTESLGEPGGGAGTYVDMMRTDATRVADALGGGDGSDGSGPTTSEG